MGRITGTDKQRTTGNVADNIRTAFWGSFPLLAIYLAAFIQPLPRYIDMKKRTSCVAPSVIKSHSCQLRLVGPSDGHLYTQEYSTRGPLWKPLQWLRQYAKYLTSCRRSGVLGAMELSDAMIVTTDHFSIFCKPLSTDQMSCPVHS